MSQDTMGVRNNGIPVMQPLLTPAAPATTNTAAPALPPRIPANLTTPQQAQANAIPQTTQPAQMQQLQGTARPGLGERIRAWFSETIKSNAGLPANITLTMPAGGGTLTLPSTAFTDMIKSLPPYARDEARQNLVPHLENRLNNGQTILTQIQMGQTPSTHTAQDVADLTLLLQTMPHRQNQGFVQGAFNIADPQGKLYNYLNSCPEKYLRGSSHLEDTQNARIDGHANMHRGIDSPRGLDGLLFGLRTTTFGYIPDGGTGGGRRLFLKPETQGCYFNNKTYFHSEELRDAIDSVPARNHHQSGDFLMSLGHTFSFIGTRGQGSALGTRKERIPDNVKDSFKSMIRQMEADNGNAALLATLKNNKPMDKSQGVHTIMENLRNAYAQVSNSPAQSQAFIDDTAELRDALSKITNIDHLEARIGNEMVLDMAEALHPAPPAVTTPAAKLATINHFIGLP